MGAHLRGAERPRLSSKSGLPRKPWRLSPTQKGVFKFPLTVNCVSPWGFRTGEMSAETTTLPRLRSYVESDSAGLEEVEDQRREDDLDREVHLPSGHHERVR